MQRQRQRKCGTPGLHPVARGWTLLQVPSAQQYTPNGEQEVITTQHVLHGIKSTQNSARAAAVAFNATNRLLSTPSADRDRQSLAAIYSPARHGCNPHEVVGVGGQVPVYLRSVARV